MRFALHLEHLLQPRQVDASILGNDHIVLYAHAAAEFGVVESGFDSDNVTRLEDLRHLRYAGWFVDFESEAVARAVEEALHAAVLHARLETPGFEQPFHFPVDLLTVHPGPNA